MNILILFETYSGATQNAAEYAASLLQQKGHTTSINRIHLTAPTEYTNYDLIIMATPSWFEEKLEGQPHILLLRYMEQFKDTSFEHMKFALFGLGDSTYAHFCGAVDKLEMFIKEHKGEIIGTPLKVDSFYFDQKKGKDAISEWIQNLPL